MLCLDILEVYFEDAKLPKNQWEVSNGLSFMVKGELPSS
jgi:hypothetical protein